MAKLIQLTCPSCGAHPQVPDNLDRAFCTFCGSEFVIEWDEGGPAPKPSIAKYMSMGKTMLRAGNPENAYSQFVKALELNPSNQKAKVYLAITTAIWGTRSQPPQYLGERNYTSIGNRFDEALAYLEESAADDDYISATIVDLFNDTPTETTKSLVELLDFTDGPDNTVVWGLGAIALGAPWRLANVVFRAVLKLGADPHIIWQFIPRTLVSGEIDLALLDMALMLAPPDQYEPKSYKGFVVAEVLMQVVEQQESLSRELRQNLLLRAWELWPRCEPWERKDEFEEWKRRVRWVKHKYGLSKPRLGWFG